MKNGRFSLTIASVQKQTIFLYVNLLLLLVGCATAEATPVPATAVGNSQQPTSQPLLPTRTPTSTVPATNTPITNTPIPPSPTPAFPRYTGAPLRPQLVGVQVHIQDEEWEDEVLAHLQALGVGWVKVQVSWKLYQPQPDEFHAKRFAQLDAFVARANRQGVRVMLGVSKAPEWSRPTTELDGPPSDFGLYRHFMAFLAQRYRGQVAAYELWNEPNLMREWNGMPLGGADFVALLREGAAGVRAHDADAVLVGGAPATTGINDGITAVDDRVYLRQMLEAGVADVVDAIGAHPYGAANPPHSSVTQPDTAVTSHNDHPSFFFGDTLHDYAALLAEYGVDRPIWVTEFGWGSFEGIAAAPPPGAEFMAQVSQRQQALYVARAFELAQAQPNVGPMILWNLNFGPLLGADFAESGYSLLLPDGSPRPAYWTLREAVSREP